MFAQLIIKVSTDSYSFFGNAYYCTLFCMELSHTK